MSIIDTFNASDYIFIIIGSFLLTLMITPIISMPSDGWEMVINMAQLYTVTLLVSGFLYGYIKSKSGELTYLTQERIYIVFFLILAILIIFIIFREIMALRHTRHGFILPVIAGLFVLICFFFWAASSALNERYGLNQPNPFMFGIRP
tara:strand:+ start:840 stop:1283 length:444 start_codon:yes stop_codon:yes gene_type:complete